jgi:hypothetical protein
MRLKRILVALRLVLLLAVYLLLVAPERPMLADERHQLNRVVGQRTFDYLVWEMAALRSKVEADLVGGQQYLTEQERSELVLTYLQMVAHARQLDGEIEKQYADPLVADPEQASAELVKTRREVGTELERLQPLAEAIMEEQLATILVEQGFGVLNRAWPPVSMRVTPLPTILVISPRDRIEQIYNISLKPGISIPEQEALEAQAYHDLDRSALVVPIGGVGIFPAMVQESSNINWLLDTMAHEWAHHWLTLHALGIRYGVSPAMRTINETVANLFGNEIGPMVVARYYPQYLPPPAAAPSVAAPEPAQAPQFDFRAEMAATRVEVDRLLAVGQVEKAEAYMEARRALFVEQGYLVRKLNQAYFAFYGAYADRPGATGSDPIGPLINSARQQSGSIRTFMDAVGGVTSFDGLQRLVEQD